jgi:DNA-binding ferritin-like protein
MKTTAKLIPELDRHLASLFVLFHQLQKHHWLVEGPQTGDLHAFLDEAYEQIHEHVDDLGERITALGGIPTCNPAEQAKLSYIDHEPEGVFRIRDMLERDLGHMGGIAQELRHTIQAARDLGDPGTEHFLMEMLLKLEDRAHHMEHYLGADSLEMGLGEEEQRISAAS